MIVTIISLVIGGLFIWYFDVYGSWQRGFILFAVLFCLPYIVLYRKYTKSLMRKTRTHSDGKPLTQQERDGLAMSGLITLQCGRCGHILREQPREKIHTRCMHKKCGGVLHDVSGFV